ncbi:MAG: matrixin family metalloprotease [Byssovorax sp.]
MGAAVRVKTLFISLAPLAAFAALTLAGAPADAFCRSTTCTGDCARDDDGCKTTGKKLFWPGVCVGVSLQRDGSVNIPKPFIQAVIDDSFATWSALDCGGTTATISFSKLTEVSCHETQYNPSAPNANVILFQDTQWHYKGEDNTLAKTTVTFDAETGQILDADIEVNHAYNEFTVSDSKVVVDLQSVLTHEIGHFIGLDHSPDPDATMFAAYDEGSTNLRTLEADDIAGACAIYPATRSGKCEPAPRNGLGDACGVAATPKPTTSGGGEASGCAIGPAPSAMAPSLLSLLGLGLALRTRRRLRFRS